MGSSLCVTGISFADRPRLLGGRLRAILPFHLRYLLHVLGAEVGHGESTEQEGQVHHRLHFLPGGTRTAGSYTVYARRVAQSDKQHPEKHELHGLLVEGLWVHASLAHLFLHGQKVRVQSRQLVYARLLAGRQEPEQVLVGLLVLFHLRVVNLRLWKGVSILDFAQGSPFWFGCVLGLVALS